MDKTSIVSKSGAQRSQPVAATFSVPGAGICGTGTAGAAGGGADSPQSPARETSIKQYAYTKSPTKLQTAVIEQHICLFILSLSNKIFLFPLLWNQIRRNISIKAIDWHIAKDGYQ